MKYTKTELFPHKSRGTFDDFYSVEKYFALEDAYAANDYVEADYVVSEDGGIYIEAHHVKYPDNKMRYKLIIQRPLFGIDAQDDALAAEMAVSLL